MVDGLDRLIEPLDRILVQMRSTAVTTRWLAVLVALCLLVVVTLSAFQVRLVMRFEAMESKVNAMDRCVREGDSFRESMTAKSAETTPEQQVDNERQRSRDECCGCQGR